MPWTRNDALVAVGAAAVDLTGYSLASQNDLGRVPVLGCLLMLVSALPLLARRRAPLAVLAAVLLAGLALNLSVPMEQHFNAALIVALYTVVRSTRKAVAAVSVLAGVTVPLVGLATWPPSPLGLAGNAAGGAVVVAAALVMNRWQREIEANRRLLADRAVAAERRRIARELHDIVAHHITTMQLMAGGARANLGGDPEVVRDALVELEGSGRMALREMRQLLDVLRADDEAQVAGPAGPAAGAGAVAGGVPEAPQPGIGDLPRIVAESSRAGLPTSLDIRGEARELPPSVALAVFRIVQEALTNARKYAGGARASVVLEYEGETVRVDVADDGAGTGTGTGTGAGTGAGTGTGPGYGLVGMRERVALHGGTLDAGPVAGGGFRVAARLPLAGAAHGRAA
ncbi:histidine kinase [Streptomyces bambusae]|uniref:sensor histidine kinase n=1 Tax=Streptomyces bambusae TaxID=1550616 RepID=UPI001CFE42BC|nr:histidine kinase [Streptomyces bambusae]MCB5164973.1 histidine kinase [Streptomyces bambusae]